VEPVIIKCLLKAVHSLEDRFPYFKVQLKKGFFWYYLEHSDLPIPVEVDDGIPCIRFHRDNTCSDPFSGDWISLIPQVGFQDPAP
jgi:hypothetical protein